MKKFCLLLAALLLAFMCVPALAEDESAEMALLLEGDWFHETDGSSYLLFDGADKFICETEDSYMEGSYAYIGGGEYRLTDDMGDEYLLSLYDDLSLGLEGVEGYFFCAYRYRLVNYPHSDEGIWLNDDGETALSFDLYGEFDLENEETFLYGEYAYQGDGEYLVYDDEGSVRLLSIYDDGSIDLEGFDGYFWLQEEDDGYNPFEDIESDEEEIGLPANFFDGNPIELAGAWYKGGDASAIPFVLDGNSYSCEHSVFGHETTGTWEMGEIIKVLTDEQLDPVAYISMESDDGMLGGWDPVPMAGNRLLYADAKDTWFLHESLIGTAEGELLLRMAEFMSADWWCVEDGSSMYLVFSCMDDAVLLTVVDGNDENRQTVVGHWTLGDGCIDVVFVDDSTACFDLSTASILIDDVEFMRAGYAEPEEPADTLPAHFEQMGYEINYEFGDGDVYMENGGHTYGHGGESFARLPVFVSMELDSFNDTQDGFVEIEFTKTVYFDSIDYPDFMFRGKWGMGATDHFFDYYTGYVLRGPATLGDTERGENYRYFEYESQGRRIFVEYNFSTEWIQHENESYSMVKEVFIRMPADYDGIVYAQVEGHSDYASYVAGQENQSDDGLVMMDDEKAQNAVFCRVNTLD